MNHKKIDTYKVLKLRYLYIFCTFTYISSYFCFSKNLGNSIDVQGNADQDKKLQELNEQIKTYKAELSDKQKEFQQEKQELQKVIEEQKEQITKGGEPSEKSEARNADVEALNKELLKAKQECKEASIEKERFQSQLEMLVDELEQKQVGILNFNL
jgi:preprotein translocase subunit SecF